MSPRRGERLMVPRAEFTSYHGRPILKAPTWREANVGGYLFFGGLAGASSLLAGGAEVTGRPRLARVTKATALAGISLSAAALVHDLGRPSRFVNMLRVVKPTSPMSLGSWLLAGYGPLAGVAAVCDLTGRFRTIGRGAAMGAADLGPAVATYTSVLIADTAVPAWHDARGELPILFVGSAASAASGMAMALAPQAADAPVRRLAVAGALTSLTMESALAQANRPERASYREGRAAKLLHAARWLGAAGALGAATARWLPRPIQRGAGLALASSSLLTRLAVFEAGVASTRDPAQVVGPQKSGAATPAASQARSPS